MRSAFRRRENRVLSIARAGGNPIGLQLYTHDPDLIEIAGLAGFDFVKIDMEHNRVNPETLVNLIRTCDAVGATPLVRVDENSPAKIRAAVESGALGIVVPHVRNAMEARQAVESSHYPPEGKCGICPAVRASGYAQDNYEEYMSYTNENVMTFVLIEDVEAVERAEEILQQLRPGRDGVGLGLADINASLVRVGEKVNWQHSFSVEAKKSIIPMAREMGLNVMGLPWPKSDLEGARNVIAQGTNVLLSFPDHHIWYEYCKEFINGLKGL